MSPDDGNKKRLKDPPPRQEIPEIPSNFVDLTAETITNKDIDEYYEEENEFEVDEAVEQEMVRQVEKIEAGLKNQDGLFYHTMKKIEAAKKEVVKEEKSESVTFAPLPKDEPATNVHCWDEDGSVSDPDDKIPLPFDGVNHQKRYVSICLYVQISLSNFLLTI